MLKPTAVSIHICLGISFLRITEWKGEFCFTDQKPILAIYELRHTDMHFKTNTSAFGT